MRFFLKMALRNLFRHARRTALTMTAIIAGIGVLNLGEGFIAGIEENIIVAAIEGTTGHFTARPSNYPTEGMQHPVDELITLTPRAHAFVREHARAWTRRVIFAPSLVAGPKHRRVRAIGYDPQTDPGVFPQHLWKIQGKRPEADGAEILVSPAVANSLSLQPGDAVVLQVRTHGGAINALRVTVAGVVTTTHTTIDAGAILVPWALTSRLVNATAPTHISVRTKSRAEGLRLAAAFGEALGSQAEIITWQSETEDLLRLQKIRRKALSFVVFILLALAAFGMANTILMAAYERVREVGTLRAMGMTKAGVMTLFLVEGAIMGLFGGIVGALWGGGLCWYWARHPLDFSELAQSAGGAFQFSTLIYTHASPTFITGSVVFALAVAAVASVYPARVAAKMIPADAVRA